MWQLLREVEGEVASTYSRDGDRRVVRGRVAAADAMKSDARDRSPLMLALP